MVTTNLHDFSKIIKMRNNFYILFFLLVCQLILAQKPSIKKANELFANKAYVEAAKMYEQLKQDQKVLQNLADSY